MLKPVIIGLGGVTNGGKTTLTNRLEEHFSADDIITTVLHLDDYYWDEDDSHHVALPDFGGYNNYDVMTSLDCDQMVMDIEQWKHMSLGASAGENHKQQILLVEGTLILNHRPLVPHFDKKYFFILLKEECWERRRLRTYLPPEPEGYFDKVAWPFYAKYRKEIQDYKDIVYINGMKAEEVIFEQVAADISELLKPSS